MFGEDTTSFQTSKVLLVGAGGIGCELLKDLIMMNIGEIHVLDLDTIDLSNLNRQFLFRHKDIKHSKSNTAIKAVEHFNHKSKLYSYHGSIMDKSMFPLSFFEQFNLIYNALDNLEARFYVNRICLYLRIPLYESGTTGLKGQVQPIYPYLTECFECIPKETPKTFPVCTIRSTPSKPVHCITWAKDFLFSQLFCESSPDDVSANSSEATTEKEIQAQNTEVNELLDLKNLIQNSKTDEYQYIYDIFRKVFVVDIQRLLNIDELWKTREKPTPLTDDIYKEVLLSETKPAKKYAIKDPNSIDINFIAKIFQCSLLRLADRFRNGEKLEFDKDDIDTLRFVMATANLRSKIFNIPLKSEFDIKQIAGNIIPAVATTNAIMAGFSALSSINYYTETTNELRVSKSKMIFDSSSLDKVVNSSKLIKPNPHCSACSVVKGIVKLDLSITKISDLRDMILQKFNYDDDIEILTLDDSKLIYDYDLEDNLNKLVSNFIKDEDVLLISDSDEVLDIIELYVINVPGSPIELPDLKIPQKKTHEDQDDVDEVEGLDSTDFISNGTKDTLIVLEDEDDGLVIEEKSSLKRKVSEENDDGNSSKKQKLQDIEILD